MTGLEIGGQVVEPHSGELAGVIAQVIPVLLLAALAIPLRLTTGSAKERQRALFDIVATGALVGVAALAEFAALFGVWHGGLSKHDRNLLAALLVVTVSLAAARILAQLARDYSDATSVPQGRVWAWLSILFLLAFVGLLVLLA